MKVRDEIVRGVRLGSILLAVLLAAVASYRIWHNAAAARAVPVQHPPEVDAPHVAPPAAVPANPPAATVPPPPPTPPAHKLTRRRTTPVAVAVETSAPEISDEPSGPEEKSPDAVENEKEMEPADVAEPAAPSVDEPAAPKSEGRAKRVLKVFGRWLHIGKKDGPAEAVRPQ